MKKLLFVVAAMLCVVGCEQFGNPNQDGENSQEIARIIYDACYSNSYIMDIVKLGTSYKITLSNGQTVNVTTNNATTPEDALGTTIKSVTIGSDDVEFLFSDGELLTIPLAVAIQVTFDIESDSVTIAPNSNFTIRYEVKSYYQDIAVDLIPSTGIEAKNEGGVIVITTSDTIPADSKLIVFVSNGKRLVKKVINIIADEGGNNEPEPEPEPEPFFRLLNNDVTVDSNGVEFYVTIETNIEYTYAIAVDWIEESKDVVSIGNERVHTFKVAPNATTEPRTTVISFCGNDTCLPFTVTQVAGSIAPIFELLSASIDVVAGGVQFDVTVVSNIEYTYSINVDWIEEVGKTSDGDSHIHIFVAKPNTTTEPRTTVISFCGNYTCLPFAVNQAAAVAEQNQLEVDTKQFTVEAAGTQSPLVVNVTSNTGWYVATTESWCVVSPANGEGDGSVSITVQPNTTTSPRIATITITTNDNAVSSTVAVSQTADKSNDDGSWHNATFEHRAVAIRFTADWCGYCPMMASSLKRANELLDGKLEVISAHASGGLCSTVAEELAYMYGISDYPTGVVNGDTVVYNTGIDEVANSVANIVTTQAQSRGCTTAASWQSSVAASQSALNLTLYLKKAGNYKVTAMLVEDGIVGYQADYTNGATNNYTHEGVIRAAFTSATGDSFTTDKDNQIKQLSLTTAIPSACKQSNLRVVVYIQRQGSNGYYIDNSATATLGIEKPLGVLSDGLGGGNEGINPGDDIVL